MSNKKRKAFTLTELLIVVVIIGVLSAVVLPKFTKVLETRKTTEAEAMMVAVRNEQEARCSISKNYTQIGQLGVYKDSSASKDKSPNFTYANNADGVGMIASAKSGKYQLEMPSYADGRVCCSDVENGGCDALNKSYPSCSELKTKADYVEGNADCGAYVPPCTGPDCNVDECPASHEEIADYTDSDGCTVKTVWELKAYPTCWVSSTSKMNCPAPTECTPDTIEMLTCNQCGKKTRTCQANGTWGEYGNCSVANRIECNVAISEDCDPALKPATTQTCGCGGTQTRSVTCMQPRFISLSATEGETLPLPTDFLSRKRWSVGKWSACQNETSTNCNDTTRKCGGRLPSEWACTPGTVKKGPVDGKHNTCKRWVSGQQQQFMEATDISLADKGEGGNTLPEVGDEGVHNNVDSQGDGGHYEEYEGNFECVDVCDRWLSNKDSCTENCRWIEASCGSAGGHGGGGGGGPGGVENYMENRDEGNTAGEPGLYCSYNITVNEGSGGGGLWCAHCSDGSISCGRVNY